MSTPELGPNGAIEIFDSRSKRPCLRVALNILQVPFCVGRAKSCHVTLNSRSIDLVQFQLELSERGLVYLVPMSSRVPTHLGKERLVACSQRGQRRMSVSCTNLMTVKRSVQLFDQDEFHVSSFRFRYVGNRRRSLLSQDQRNEETVGGFKTPLRAFRPKRSQTKSILKVHNASSRVSRASVRSPRPPSSRRKKSVAFSVTPQRIVEFGKQESCSAIRARKSGRKLHPSALVEEFVTLEPSNIPDDTTPLSGYQPRRLSFSQFAEFDLSETKPTDTRIPEIERVLDELLDDGTSNDIDLFSASYDSDSDDFSTSSDEEFDSDVIVTSKQLNAQALRSLSQNGQRKKKKKAKVILDLGTTPFRSDSHSRSRSTSRRASSSSSNDFDFAHVVTESRNPLQSSWNDDDEDEEEFEEVQIPEEPDGICLGRRSSCFERSMLFLLPDDEEEEEEGEDEDEDESVTGKKRRRSIEGSDSDLDASLLEFEPPKKRRRIELDRNLDSLLGVDGEVSAGMWTQRRARNGM